MRLTHRLRESDDGSIKSIANSLSTRQGRGEQRQRRTRDEKKGSGYYYCFLG